MALPSFTEQMPREVEIDTPADNAQEHQAESAPPAPGPAADPAPPAPPAAAPILPTQSREDTDIGWGEYRDRDDDDRLLRDRPPHWDNA